jgi:RHH-type rel operon transcriptional repressor/antitoxin RelB
VAVKWLYNLYTSITKETEVMETVPVSGRIDKTVSKRLDALSKSTARSRSFLIAEAVKAYVDEQAWQIRAIEAGLEAANRGEFASDEKVAKAFTRYGVSADED